MVAHLHHRKKVVLVTVGLVLVLQVAQEQLIQAVVEAVHLLALLLAAQAALVLSSSNT